MKYCRLVLSARYIDRLWEVEKRDQSRDITHSDPNMSALNGPWHREDEIGMFPVQNQDDNSCPLCLFIHRDMGHRFMGIGYKN